MEKAEDYLYKEHPVSTFIFCPLLGVNLSKALKKPAMIEQEILNEAIWIFVAVGLNAHFIELPYWDNMSQAHMVSHPVTLY